MWEDEHAGFREEVGVNALGLDYRQDLAIDQVQHVLPYFGRNSLQSIGSNALGKRQRRGAEPNF